MTTQKKKTSQAQLDAINRWRKNNREASRINSYKQSAKTFVRHHATEEDLEKLYNIFYAENKNAIKKGVKNEKK